MAQIRVWIVAVAATAIAAGLARPKPVEGGTVQAHSTEAKPLAVVETGEFMELLVKTSYVELQQAMAKPPADRTGWATIYQKAVRLAEIQNLLFFRDRREVSDPRWAAAAANSRQAAADLASAAVASLRNLDTADYNGARTKYAAVAASCNVCHRTFTREAPTIKP